FKKFIIKKVLLPQSHANIGAKSKIYLLRILFEGQWWEQNQPIHCGYLYFKSHTIHIRRYISLGAYFKKRMKLPLLPV
ncbi:unnamed protein product, partial [Porites evermanni]